MSEINVPPVERKPRSRETLGRRLERRAELFEKFPDSQAGILVVEWSERFNGGLKLVADHESDRSFFAASINKIPLAYVLAESKYKSEKGIYPQLESLTGAGRYDDIEIDPTDPPYRNETELVADMLQNSGNTAAKMLKDALRPEVINDTLYTHGFITTQLEKGKDGSYHLGRTTPIEALTLLHEVVDPYPVVNEGLTHTIRRALAENTRPTGIRAAMPKGSKLKGAVIANKTGEYNGDDEVPAVRHDVGLVVVPGRRYSYAIMSTSRSPFLAEAFRHACTADILENAGYLPVKAARYMAGKIFEKLAVHRP